MLSNWLAAFLLLSSAAVPRADSVAPMTPEDVILSLDESVPVDAVTATLGLDDGVVLVVDYNLGGVGRVSVMLDTDAAGSGRGLITVREAPVVEVVLQDGAVASQAAEWSALAPSEVRAVAASLVQVWSEVELTAATQGAQDLKCTIAGGLAGAVAGVGVGAACWLLTKADLCVGTGVTITSNVGGYITDKCNGAQNK
ncbi:hypothetical protein SAMN02745121_09066 [Nannocystis exedens]|uniref:Uncharacterized protein n=1 Tax=Nannocystis exedens TaxID=54 RepID=A0A1I2IXL8_9BACT|nr:hypothetical protein [Nannocystis exedens]SFF46939.1 hypothetical protein SAMN02745121_09066 [Nannocystis exedens]